MRRGESEAHRSFWRSVARIGVLSAVVVAASALPPPVQAASAPVVKVPKKKITVYRVEVGFQNSKMATEKSILQPTFQRIGVILGDTILFKAVLTPAVILASNKFSWTGVESGTGQSISVSSFRIGPNNETITAGKKTKAAVTSAVTVDPPNETQWCALHLPSCLTVSNTGDEARDWASTNEAGLGGGIHNGKADAARHSYWNALMVIDGLSLDLALGASTAHERTNLEATASAARNEIVMDLENNRAGANIGTSLGSGASRATADSSIRSALSAGTLTILDNLTNPNDEGLLQPSNK